MNLSEVLGRVLPPGRVLTDAAVLAAHRHDYWALEAIRDVGGAPSAPPACVVFPESTEEVAAVLRLAHAERIPVVPYGSGSGVCGGVKPGADAVVVDMTRMARLVEVRRQSLVGVAEAGLNGAECERLLAAEGLTLGHFPQSIALSTVGGWVATRASGQLSTRYGNIEDLLLALEVVLPGGAVLRTAETPRAATGPDLKSLFLGSEGTLGIVTQVTLKLAPAPTWQEGFAVKLPRFDDGLEVSRELLQAGWRPAVLRLYDESEAARHFGTWLGTPSPLLLIMNQGTAAMADALWHELEAAKKAALGHQGEIIGDEPLKHWLAHRNEVPSWEGLLRSGLVADTIEVAATWERVGELYASVTAAMRAVPGIIAATGHTSHGYTTGMNIYFTFVGAATEPAEQERIYRQAWAAAMEASLACNATIAHHHGIGRVRRDWLPREVGAAGMVVLRAVKHALDPHGIMNPGVLI
ncbi:MAG TPA: FAD-binding oxidoreductase [Candidatus Bathyarchaeia archaeon]|nr:FAD-binding oxidoreductase [Candidatus Bathyarchaeia archaeon]